MEDGFVGRNKVEKDQGPAACLSVIFEEEFLIHCAGWQARAWAFFFFFLLSLCTKDSRKKGGRKKLQIVLFSFFLDSFLVLSFYQCPSTRSVNVQEQRFKRTPYRPHFLFCWQQKSPCENGAFCSSQIIVFATCMMLRLFHLIRRLLLFCGLEGLWKGRGSSFLVCNNNGQRGRGRRSQLTGCGVDKRKRRMRDMWSGSGLASVLFVLQGSWVNIVAMIYPEQ